MSRETNSLLLRCGITNFWSQHLNKPTLAFINLQFNSFFFLVLRNYFLIPLKIQYFQNAIFIYTFYFKDDRYSFLYKFIKLKETIIRSLKYRLFYGLSTKKRSVQTTYIFSFFLLVLILKFFIIKFNYFILKKIIFFNLGNSIKKQNFLFRLKKKELIKKNYTVNLFRKLKLINYILKFKWLGLFCNFLIYIYTKKSFNIIIKSLLDKSIVFNRYPFVFKYLKSSNVRQKFYLVFLSFLFLQAKILLIYIAFIMKKTKNKKHIKNLITFFKELKSIVDKTIIPCNGLKFKICGRLGGKLRKSCFGYKLGSTALMTLNTLIDYSCEYIYTQYGSFSLKLWLTDKHEHSSLNKKNGFKI